METGRPPSLGDENTENDAGLNTRFPRPVTARSYSPISTLVCSFPSRITCSRRASGDAMAARVHSTMLHVLVSNLNEENNIGGLGVSSTAKLESYLRCRPKGHLRYAVSTWSAVCLSLLPKTSFAMRANSFRQDTSAVSRMVKQACAGTS